MRIKTILLTLTLLINPILASEDFSEEAPRIRHVFSADISRFLEWDTDDSYSRTDQCWEAVENIFKTIGFQGVPGAHESMRMGAYDRDFIFGRFDSSRRLKDILFVHLEHSTRSRSLHLASAECRDSDFVYSTHKILSWSFVNTIQEPILYYGREAKGLIHKISTDISRKGLKESVTRIGFVINDDYEGSFYTVFENRREEEKGAAILQELQDSFIFSVPL